MPLLNKDQISSPDFKIRVSPKISIGFGTIAGSLASVAQYAGALALMLQGNLTAESLGTMSTATATLLFTLYGRFSQARDAINAIGPASASAIAYGTVDRGNSTPLTEFKGVAEPEANVLYLDGKAIAEAVVKAINTQALVAAMRAGVTPDVPNTAGATATSAPVSNEVESS